MRRFIQKLRLTPRVVINSSAFLILGMLLVFILAVRVLPTVFGSTYPIYGIFTAAGGVAPEQEVTYRGVQVGRVGHMTLTRDAVKIEMKIESKYKIPKEGTRARVLFKSAVGEQFIDLLPERSSGPTFRPGDVIPVTMTSIPVQTEELLRELDTVLRSVDPVALGKLVHELGQGLTGHGQDLHDAIGALDVLARIGAERRNEVSGLIGNAADVQDSFNASREQFVSAIHSLRTVLATLASRRTDLQRTLTAMRSFDGDIIALLDKRRAQINRILSDLGTTVRNTHAHLTDVDRILTYIGPFLNDATKAYQAPYFVFNLNTNLEDPGCVYDPSSRPLHDVQDPTVDEPAYNFACSGGTLSATSGSIGELPAAIRAQLDQISWLQLFTLGY